MKQSKSIQSKETRRLAIRIQNKGEEKENQRNLDMVEVEFHLIGAAKTKMPTGY